MDEFQKILPSDNILKLRKLTEEICGFEPDVECKINKLRELFEIFENAIESTKNQNTKIKKYEEMFLEIRKILY
jgi:hypothetical protein